MLERRARDARLLLQLVVLALLAVSGGAAASRWLDQHPAVSTACHGQCVPATQGIAPLLAPTGHQALHALPTSALAPFDWVAPRPVGLRLALHQPAPRFAPGERPRTGSRAPPRD